MKLNLKIIPHKEQIFNTIGYWTDDEIWISQMTDWRYIVCVIFHELIEWAWCKHKGITQAQCDAFDAMYEELYKSGKVPIGNDPGDDRKCPYYGGHQWGNRFERVAAWILKVNWKKYCADCDEIYEQYSRSYK